MAVVYSTKSGNWSDPTVWGSLVPESNGVVPGTADDVFIEAGHIVDLDESATIKSLTCNGGTITVNAPDGLTLEAVVSIDAGVTANSGSGFIQVGTVSDGQTFTITAPVFYGSTSEVTGSMLVVSYSATGKLILNGNCMAKNSGIVWTRGRINLEVNGTEHGFVPGAKTIAEGSNCIQSISTYTKIVGDLLGGDVGNSNTYYVGNHYVFSEIYGDCYGGSTAPIDTATFGSMAISFSNYNSANATTTIVYGNVYGGSAENNPAIVTGINANRNLYVYGDIQASATSWAVYNMGKEYALLGYGNNLRDSAGNIEPLSSETITAINYVEGIGFGWLITAAIESIDDLMQIEAAGLMRGKFVQVSDISGDWDGYMPIGSLQPFVGEYTGYDYISGNAYKIIESGYPELSLHNGLFGTLSGIVNNVQIVNLYIGSDGYAGGLAAEAFGATITRCSVRGHMIGGGIFGGLCGEASYTSFDECYCHVTTIGRNVGLIGEGISNTFTNCYHTREGDTNGTYKTEAELKQKATFTNWDFDTVWDIDVDSAINSGYPFLSIRSSVPSMSNKKYLLGTSGAIPILTGVFGRKQE